MSPSRSSRLCSSSKPPASKIFVGAELLADRFAASRRETAGDRRRLRNGRTQTDPLFEIPCRPRGQPVVSVHITHTTKARCRRHNMPRNRCRVRTHRFRLRIRRARQLGAVRPHNAAPADGLNCAAMRKLLWFYRYLQKSTGPKVAYRGHLQGVNSWSTGPATKIITRAVRGNAKTLAGQEPAHLRNFEPVVPRPALDRASAADSGGQSTHGSRRYKSNERPIGPLRRG